ncbi:hypothetical protein ACFE04_006627 [Oxalis oulophora]
MERLSNTDTVLLTYTPQKPFMTTPRSSSSNSDIDFNDVFGGPPRRSSMPETTYSLTQTRHSFGKDNGQSSDRSSWSGLSEKPVFGEEGKNRRYPSEDFFDDIFRGNESVTSSPRKPDSTAPSSLVLSPARSMAPKTEPFDLSPSGNFSLPVLTQAKDIPVFGSSTRNPTKHKDGGNYYSHSTLSRFSNESQDDSRNELHSTSLESPLLQQLSPSSKESSKPDETYLKKSASISLQDSVNNGQFHFSIYKWASKGVPLAVPFRGGTSSRLKEVKLEKSTSSNGRIERELPERISHYSSKVITDSIRMTFSDLLNEPQPQPEPYQIVAETNIPTSDTKPEINSVEDRLHTVVEDTRVETKPHSLHESTTFSEKPVQQTTETPKDAQKKSKSQLPSIFVSDNNQEGVYEKTEDVKGKQSTSKSSTKSSLRETRKSIKKLDESSVLDHGKEEKTNLQGSPVKSENRQDVYEIAGEAKGKGSMENSSNKPSSRETRKSIKKPDERSALDSGEQGKINLHGFSAKYGDRQGMYEETGDAKAKESASKSSKKSSLRETSKTDKKPDREINTGGEEKGSGNNGGIDNKVKVKEFIKIFNQEAPSKLKVGVDPQNQNSRSKERVTSKAKSEVKASSDETIKGKLASKEHKMESTPDFSSPVVVFNILVLLLRSKSMNNAFMLNTSKLETKLHGLKLKLSSQEDKLYEQKAEQHFTVEEIKYTSFQQKDIAESSTSSIADDSKTSFIDTEDFFQENFEVKELPQDENISPQTVDDVEDMQVIETKIRQWAFGKEGNIRSLLSTLQYVLWEGSGWKPVPLMNIIEGNAVRKAYQRALLCLHPDKLQQKGATSQQKHIAEKVFDVLQDAWIHFNGSI